ncbi:MAG: hypothetical protein J5871_02845 [Bacteroidales bacterium]|nr:hypothetical protein [Bacteroidales bacterium]
MRILPLLLLLLGLSACHRPASYELFIKGAAERYDFSLDLSDSSCTYDIAFFTRVDTPVFRRDSLPDSFPMTVRWSGPSGQAFEETVYYPVRESRVPYRSGVVPVEYGNWTLSVRLPQPPGRLRGLGLICRYGPR